MLYEVIKTNELGTKQKLKLIFDFDTILGLKLNEIKLEKIPKNIQELANQRELLRKEKKFQEADNLRQEIEQLGYQLADTKDGIIISKK